MTQQGMEQRLGQMESKLTAVEQKVNNIDGKLDRVLKALQGDDMLMSEGLIQEMNLLKARMTKVETRWNKFAWMAAGAGISGGLFIQKLIEWIQSSGK